MLGSMNSKFWLMSFCVFLAMSCQKKLGLAWTGEEGKKVVEQFRSQERAPVSARINALTSQGGFNAELYLEPAATVLGVVYGYTPLGQSLFEFELQGKNFLLLDFLASRAYSNNRDWLVDGAKDGFLQAQDQMLFWLIQVLLSLAGEIEAPTEFSRSPAGFVVAKARSGNYEINYFFRPASARLERMEIGKNSLEMTFEFAYREDCWFPGRIFVKNSGFKASLQTIQLLCPQGLRPQMNFSVPQGFSQVLLTAP